MIICGMTSPRTIFPDMRYLQGFCAPKISIRKRSGMLNAIYEKFIADKNGAALRTP